MQKFTKKQHLTIQTADLDSNNKNNAALSCQSSTTRIDSSKSKLIQSALSALNKCCGVDRSDQLSVCRKNEVLTGAPPSSASVWGNASTQWSVRNSTNKSRHSRVMSEMVTPHGASGGKESAFSPK